jgi:hypothetical protein
MVARGPHEAAGEAADHRVLCTTTASAWGPLTAAFVQRLRELG